LLPAVLLLVPSVVRAELVCPEPAAAAGDVRSGMPLARRFVLRNTGTSALEISDAKPSCGCLKPRLEKRRYEPGEEGAILVEINTLTQAAGPHQWRVMVQYREGGERKELPLFVTATVHSELLLEPAALNLHTSTTCRHQVTLTENRPQPLKIVAVQTTHPELRVRVQPVQEVKSGQWIRTIEVEVVDSFPEGKHDVMVQLFTDDSDYRELKVPVGVVKRSRKRVQAAPASASFVGKDAQAIPARIVLLSGPDDQTVEVGTVQADHPAIQCRWAAGPGTMATLKISFDPARIQADNLQGSVQVRLKKPEGEQVSIPVSWSRD
jgi:hypothetical protein